MDKVFVYHPFCTCTIVGTIFSHCFCPALLVVGAVAMVADAVIVEEEWLEDEIYRLMDPISNNNPYLRDYFLCNMYRIVSYHHNIFLIIRTRE